MYNMQKNALKEYDRIYINTQNAKKKVVKKNNYRRFIYENRKDS